MKKEILGYKLNDLGRQNEKAALIVTHCIERGWSDNPLLDIYVNFHGVDLARTAGVLDLWFDPVYKEEPEFNVGDWVIGWHASVIENYKNKAWQIESFNEGHFPSPKHGYATGLEDIRHATPKEIKTALLAEAKRRYPVGTRYKCVANGDGIFEASEDPYIYEDDSDYELCIAFGDLKGLVYGDGKWAEIITEPEQPKRTKKQIKKEIRNLLKKL